MNSDPFALGHELVELRVLDPQVSQALDVHGLELPEARRVLAGPKIPGQVGTPLLPHAVARPL
jgi:hypothetical protein